MKFRTELMNEARDKTFKEVHDPLLRRIQAIQKEYGQEVKIPKDHEFWNLKAKLIEFVQSVADGMIKTKEIKMDQPASTFRSRTLGKVKNQEIIDVDPIEVKKEEDDQSNPARN